MSCTTVFVHRVPNDREVDDRVFQAGVFFLRAVRHDEDQDEVDELLSGPFREDALNQAWKFILDERGDVFVQLLLRLVSSLTLTEGISLLLEKRGHPTEACSLVEEVTVLLLDHGRALLLHLVDRLLLLLLERCDRRALQYVLKLLLGGHVFHLVLHILWLLLHIAEGGLLNIFVRKLRRNHCDLSLI